MASHGINRPSASVIENFDGLAGQAGDDIARSGGPPPGMFSTAGIRPVTLSGNFSSAPSAQRPQHAGRAAHVVFHLVHALARLGRDAASIEGHALADQYVGLMRRRPRR